MTPRELTHLGAVACVFGLVLTVAELARARGMASERSRKVVHLFSGLTTAAFPWIFENVASVVLLAASYAALMVVTRWRGWLDGVHGVGRRTAGVFFYPAAVALLFAMARHRPAAYVAALLVLAVADAAAALAGRSARLRYHVFGQRKSVGGSVAFFACAVPCVFIPMMTWSGLSPFECLVWSLHASLLATCVEAICPGGSDNLGIPLVTGLVLLRATSAPVPFATLPLAAAAALLVAGCSWPRAGRRLIPS